MSSRRVLSSCFRRYSSDERDARTVFCEVFCEVVGLPIEKVEDMKSSVEFVLGASMTDVFQCMDLDDSDDVDFMEFVTGPPDFVAEVE